MIYFKEYIKLTDNPILTPMYVTFKLNKMFMYVCMCVLVRKNQIKIFILFWRKEKEKFFRSVWVL